METSWLQLQLGLPLKRPPCPRERLPAEAGVDEDVAGAAEVAGVAAQEEDTSAGLGAGQPVIRSLRGGWRRAVAAAGCGDPGRGEGRGPAGHLWGAGLGPGGLYGVLVVGSLSRVGVAGAGTAQPSWEEVAVPAAGQPHSAAPSPCSTVLDLLLQPRTRENFPGFSCLQGHEE